MKRQLMVKLMDNLEKRLKNDASLIKAEVSAEMQERILASLQSTQPVSPDPKKPESRGMSLWLTSSLTGLAAAALIIVLVNWNTSIETNGETDSMPSVPSLSEQIPFPLSAETVEWTAPLEEELRNLQSDLEKARKNVERDLRESF